MHTHSPIQHDRTVHERVPGLRQRGGVCGVQGALPQGPQNASPGLPTGLVLRLRQGPLVIAILHGGPGHCEEGYFFPGDCGQ